MSADNDPILARMTEDERAAYEEARANGYALVKAAHEIYIAAWARGKSKEQE